jgi:hypothetical protein
MSGPAAGDGGQVTVHWTQSGPTVQSGIGGPLSPEDDDDIDDEGNTKNILGRGYILEAGSGPALTLMVHWKF